jgi:hypothetical protein
MPARSPKGLDQKASSIGNQRFDNSLRNEGLRLRGVWCRFGRRGFGHVVRAVDVGGLSRGTRTLKGHSGAPSGLPLVLGQPHSAERDASTSRDGRRAGPHGPRRGVRSGRRIEWICDIACSRCWSHGWPRTS